MPTLQARVRGLAWRPLGRRRPTVSGVDLDIAPGERIGLVGPSGAGKSTVVHAIAGVLGEAIPGELTGAVRVDGSVGLVLQDPGAAVVADRIGRDIAFGPENLGVDRDEIWRRVRDAATRVGLDRVGGGSPGGGRSVLDRPTSALSGGERQRLALAGALALRPGLLLLDEPTSMLDPDTSATVRAAVLNALDGRRTALLVVDHHIGPWLEHLDRVLVMGSDGTLHHDLPAADLVTRYGPELTTAGVWLPGFAAPEPLALPDALVRPAPPDGGPHLGVDGLGVDGLGVELVSRRMRGVTRTRALSGLDARVPAGTLTAITGPSGAGKSTLVVVLAGLQAPQEGQVTGLPGSPWKWRSRDLARVAGWVPQDPEHGFLTSRVRDEIVLTAAGLGLGVDVDLVLDVLGLAHRAGVNPYRLSGGEQRRLALAAALAHRPALLLADEPTVGQDRHTWAAVAGWLVGAARTGATTAVSTHDDHLIRLAGHRIALSAPTTAAAA